MFITSCMMAVVMFRIWKWNPTLASLAIGLFLVVDGAYFASNLTKFVDGGWFPAAGGRGRVRRADHLVDGRPPDARAAGRGCDAR
jgi:hypothetical protein